MDTRRQEKAAATARDYGQGNIAGLDDAMTRRLVASTVFTESNGGDLSITNQQGYVGRYQAGAGWLADAGYVDKGKLAVAMTGYKSEWAWAESGGMTRFLQDNSNWKQGLSLEKYKQSSDLQDQAFKRNSDVAYQRAIDDQVLQPGDDPAKIAGFLKARHISGYGGAKGVLQGKSPRTDSNGTSNYDYYNDIVNNRDGLDQRMSLAASSIDHHPVPGSRATVHDGEGNVVKQGEKGKEVSRLQQTLDRLGYHDAHGRPIKVDGDFGIHTKEAVIAFQKAHGLHVDGVVGHDTREALRQAERTPLLSERTHPDYPLFREAREGVRQLPAGTFRNGMEENNAAAMLAQKAKDSGMSRIDHVLMNTRGDGVFAVQGNPQDPARHLVSVDKAQAAAQSVERSTELLAARDVNHLQSVQVHTQMQHQEHHNGLSMIMRP
jgi:X-Tfes, XVIPCD/Putative peptidoglycan binding domain